MTKPIQVGDLVISRGTFTMRAMVGRPALVIEVIAEVGDQIRLKVGAREWWDHCDDCEKVSE